MLKPCPCQVKKKKKMEEIKLRQEFYYNPKTTNIPELKEGHVIRIKKPTGKWRQDPTKLKQMENHIEEI